MQGLRFEPRTPQKKAAIFFLTKAKLCRLTKTNKCTYDQQLK